MEHGSLEVLCNEQGPKERRIRRRSVPAKRCGEMESKVGDGQDNPEKVSSESPPSTV